MVCLCVGWYFAGSIVQCAKVKEEEKVQCAFALAVIFFFLDLLVRVPGSLTSRSRSKPIHRNFVFFCSNILAKRNAFIDIGIFQFHVHVSAAATVVAAADIVAAAVDANFFYRVGS